MKSVHIAPMRWTSMHEPAFAGRLQSSVRTHAPAVRQFASKQTRERPMLVAGSLIALGMIPMAAIATRMVLSRPHAAPVIDITLPRNQEWYTGE